MRLLVPGLLAAQEWLHFVALMSTAKGHWVVLIPDPAGH
jgi:hypothetical protein